MRRSPSRIGVTRWQTRAPSNTTSVLGAVLIAISRSGPRREHRMAQSAGRLSGIVERQQHSEMPAAVEVVIVVPADMVAGLS